MSTYVHTLAYNTPNMVRDAVRSLTMLNKGVKYEHLLIDLEYPLDDEHWNKIPEDIEAIKDKNYYRNKVTAMEFYSHFCQMENVGVSQNWTQAAKWFGLQDTDVLICADPDERPQNEGWVKAIADVIAADPRIGWVSMMMKEQQPLIDSGQYLCEEVTIAGHRCYKMRSVFNWAQGGFNGKFINEAGGVPYPQVAKRYGWIETACMEKFAELGYYYVILSDYYVEHIASSPLAGEWKVFITSNQTIDGSQMSFEEWLEMKRG